MIYNQIVTWTAFAILAMFLICIPPPLKVPQRPHVHPPLVESLRRPVTTASASTGWPSLSSTSDLKSTHNNQTPPPSNADPASATVAATAAMAATRLVAERTTFVNPTSTRWAPIANRQTDIEHQMGNNGKQTNRQPLRTQRVPGGDQWQTGKQTNRHRVPDGEQTNKQQVIAINLGNLRDLKHCYSING